MSVEAALKSTVGDVKKVEHEGHHDFGSDEVFVEGGEAATVLQEKLRLQAKQHGADKESARSLIVLEVAPKEAECDLETIAKGIKEIKHKGIQNWGVEHRIEPVAFGINKLVISVVVYDELIDVEQLSDLITEKFGDDIQSIDVHAMSKV